MSTNREIKFRGQRIPNKEWVYGSLVNNLWCYSDLSDFKEGTPICEIITGKYEGDCWEDVVSGDEESVITVYPDTVGQFTGLLDKNNNPIYEGDIVRILYTDWPSKTESDKGTLQDYKNSISHIGKVVFSNGAFQLELWSKKYNEFHTASIHHGTHGEIEIIGDIFQNLELLSN